MGSNDSPLPGSCASTVTLRDYISFRALSTESAGLLLKMIWIRPNCFPWIECTRYLPPILALNQVPRR